MDGALTQLISNTLEMYEADKPTYNVFDELFRHARTVIDNFLEEPIVQIRSKSITVYNIFQVVQLKNRDNMLGDLLALLGDASGDGATGGSATGARVAASVAASVALVSSAFLGVFLG